ncbi:hypothetical protein [Pseudomonas citronellolis]|nr:hypothetical protein [Pseudomonas citronellolis]MDF3934181.1 hypothetical protein [Pseudomonas citronellolis]
MKALSVFHDLFDGEKAVVALGVLSLGVAAAFVSAVLYLGLSAGF